jgi:hypothetical protein
MRTLVIELSGRYKLAGARFSAVRRRGPRDVKESKRGGVFANVSETEEQWEGLFIGISKCQGPLRKMDSVGFARLWADSGRFQPSTVESFFFSFSARTKEFLENYTKMIKMQD